MKAIIKAIIKFLRAVLGYPEDVADTVDGYDVMDPAVAATREEYALDQLEGELKYLGVEYKISRRETFCKLMELDNVDYKDRSEVAGFFWRKGVSNEQIAILIDEFYSLQNKRFGGE